MCLVECVQNTQLVFGKSIKCDLFLMGQFCVSQRTSGTLRFSTRRHRTSIFPLSTES